MRKIIALACIGFLSGCAAERAIVAQDAQQKMVGLSKEQLFTCMGPPVSKSAEGATEMWTYSSGNGHTSIAAMTTATANTHGPGMSGNASTFGVASQRYCIVNVAIVSGSVSRVNYSGPTGGLITGDEQCAFAVRNCVK